MYGVHYRITFPIYFVHRQCTFLYQRQWIKPCGWIQPIRLRYIYLIYLVALQKHIEGAYVIPAKHAQLYMLYTALEPIFNYCQRIVKFFGAHCIQYFVLRAKKQVGYRTAAYVRVHQHNRI